MENPEGHLGGVPSVVELLDELQRIRNMAPGTEDPAESRALATELTGTRIYRSALKPFREHEPPPSYSPPTSLRRVPDAARFHEQNQEVLQTSSLSRQHRPVYRTTGHRSDHATLQAAHNEEKWRRNESHAPPRPQLDNDLRPKSWSQNDTSCPEEPRRPLSDWLRHTEVGEEDSLPSDWLAPPPDQDSGSSTSIMGSCGRVSPSARSNREGSSPRCGSSCTVAVTGAEGVAVVTTPPQRSARPQTLCLDFPTPPSEFLSSDSPRRHRRPHRPPTSCLGPFSITGGGVSSLDRRRADEGGDCSRRMGQSVRSGVSPMLSFRSEPSSGASLDSVGGARGQGTPLVWSANSRRCSRELLDVPNQPGFPDIHMCDMGHHPPPYRDQYRSMPDGMWRAHSAEVITRHSLHMDEIAHMAKDQNMVRRRSADLLEECLRRHTRSLPEVDTLQMVGLVTANQIVSKRRWRRMVLRERAVDTFAVACGGTCCIACLYACVAYFFLPGTWPTVFGPCDDPLCALK